VVQHARAVDEVEALAEGSDLLDTALVPGEVSEPVLVLQVPLVGEARRAEVAPHHAGARVVERVDGRGVGAAAGDQHVEVLPRRLGRPEGVPVALEVAAHAHALAFGRSEVGDGVRVDPALVLGGDRVGVRLPDLCAGH